MSISFDYDTTRLDKHTSCVLGSYELMAKVSITQKQLETLSRQLYGKEKVSLKLPLSAKAATQSNPVDLANDYLRSGLIKISLFSAVAILIQVLLSYALKNNLLKISF